MNWRTAAAFTIVGAVWGSSWLFMPSLPGPPLLAGAARFAIAAVLLISIAAPALLRRRHRISGTQLKLPTAQSVLLGFTLIGLPYALAVWAKDLVSTGVVTVLFAAMPLVVLFLERDGNLPRLIPATALGMGGITLVVGQGIDYSLRQVGGVSLLAGAVGLIAFSLNYAKRHIQPGHFLLSSTIQCAVAAVLLMFLSGTRGIPSPVQWNWGSVAMLTALAAAGGVIALPLLFLLLSEVEAWQAATLQWVQTLIAVAEAGWLLRAKPTFEMLAGAIVTVSSLVWMMRYDCESVAGEDAVTLQITSTEERRPNRSDSERR